jgi:hypothetical protein
MELGNDVAHVLASQARIRGIPDRGSKTMTTAAGISRSGIPRAAMFAPRDD